MDEAISKTRVITQDWAGAPVSVKKIAASYFAFLNALEASRRGTVSPSSNSAAMAVDGSEDDTSAPARAAALSQAYDRFLSDIAGYELTLSQLPRVEERCKEEVLQYRDHQARTEALKEEAARHLEDLKRELEHEKIKRERKKEYEAQAKEVNKARSRQELLAAIEGLEADRLATEHEGRDLDALLEKRKQQFSLIFSSIAGLQRLLDDEQAATKAALEEEAKKKRAAAGASASAVPTGPSELEAADAATGRQEEGRGREDKKADDEEISSEVGEEEEGAEEKIGSSEEAAEAEGASAAQDAADASSQEEGEEQTGQEGQENV